VFRFTFGVECVAVFYKFFDILGEFFDVVFFVNITTSSFDTNI